MPRVPNVAKASKSPLIDADVSPTNILLAAAEMHRMGRLTQPEEASAQPSIRPRNNSQVVRSR